jgi:hypothetical protein
MSTALRKRPDHLACAAAPTPRAQDLARRLSAMLPQAAAVHLRLLDGRRTRWPHLELTATDEAGAEVRVNRTQALTAARAVIRTHPDAGWQRGHTFSLRTALLDGGAV